MHAMSAHLCKKSLVIDWEENVQQKVHGLLSLQLHVIIEHVVCAVEIC
jgi:hypothetical protein